MCRDHDLAEKGSAEKRACVFSRAWIEGSRGGYKHRSEEVEGDRRSELYIGHLRPASGSFHHLTNG